MDVDDAIEHMDNYSRVEEYRITTNKCSANAGYY